MLLFKHGFRLNLCEQFVFNYSMLLCTVDVARYSKMKEVNLCIQEYGELSIVETDTHSRRPSSDRRRVAWQRNDTGTSIKLL